jgi:hypothetical protein
MFQADLQILLYDLDDMHRPSHNIEEDMEFQRRLSIKQFLKICLEKLITFSYVSTFETNAS